MPPAPLVVITGPPGAGKTTVSRLVASRFAPTSCCMESDWWWSTIVNGLRPPWEASAHDQNRAVVRSFVAAASAMACGGYPTVVDGIVGPWMLDLIAAEVTARQVTTHYVILRPSREVAIDRATKRVGSRGVRQQRILTDDGPVRKMWDEFSELDQYELHVLDNTDQTPNETSNHVWALVEQESHVVFRRPHA